MDGVSDRDFCVELLSAFSVIMMHLSRFSEEIILWSSWEFGFVELSDAYTTGSSIMPQKKNSDMAELVRGKTGRVYGDLIGTLTMLKGLPLAYNKDMQEDKEAIFDGCETVKLCLSVFAPMVAAMRVKKDNMKKSESGCTPPVPATISWPPTLPTTSRKRACPSAAHISSSEKSSQAASRAV